MSKNVFKKEEKLSRSEISDKMRKIAEGVENGEVNLKSGGESVQLRLSEECEFEVEVEEESDGEISLEIEIEWKKGGDNADLEIE